MKCRWELLSEKQTATNSYLETLFLHSFLFSRSMWSFIFVRGKKKSRDLSKCEAG